MNLEFSGYRVVSKDDTCWNAVTGFLSELNASDNDKLIRLLERCCRICEESIEIGNNLSGVLSADEMLEEDILSEREDRKKSRGFVTPSTAIIFLADARSAPLSRVMGDAGMPHIARAYFKSAFAKPETDTASDTASESPVATEGTPGQAGKRFFEFMDVLRTGQVLPENNRRKLGFDGFGDRDSRCVLLKSMRILNLSDPEHKDILARMALLLRRSISSGSPWQFQDQMDYLHVFLDGETVAALIELIREYPTFPHTLGRNGGSDNFPFISSRVQIQSIRHFLGDTLLRK